MSDMVLSIVEEGETRDLTATERDSLVALGMIRDTCDGEDSEGIYARSNGATWADIAEALRDKTEKTPRKATHVTEGSGGSGGYAIYSFPHYVIHFSDGTCETTQQWMHSHGKRTRARILAEYKV